MAFWDSPDQLDPRAALPAEQRASLRTMAESVVRRAWVGLLTSLEMDQDAVWRQETGRDEQGWLPLERARFEFWVATGHSLRAAGAWPSHTRLTFVRYLIGNGLLGAGDRDKDAARERAR